MLSIRIATLRQAAVDDRQERFVVLGNMYRRSIPADRGAPRSLICEDAGLYRHELGTRAPKRANEILRLARWRDLRVTMRG